MKRPRGRNTAFLLLFINLICQGVCTSWKKNVQVEANSNKGWIDWFSDTFNRVIYICLMTGIISCTIYNFVKNKLENRRDNSAWTSSTVDIKNYSNIMELVDPKVSEENIGEKQLGESENRLKQRLKDTLEEIEQLKKQLKETMDDKTELESTLALLDKEKISAELKLEMNRVEERVELEKIKNENAFVQREIQKILEEKEAAEKEVERLDRDIEICRTANLDSLYLKDRVYAAKQEANVLKTELIHLKKENGINTLPSQISNLWKESDSTLEEINDEKNFSWSDQDLSREYSVIFSN